MGDVRDIFEKYELDLMANEDKTSYLEYVSNIYNIGKIYFSGIINYYNEELGLNGQRGFAHNYLIEIEDVVSVCSGFYPLNMEHFNKINTILGITPEDRENYLNDTLNKLYNKGASEEIGLDKNLLDFKNFTNPKKFEPNSNVLENLMFSYAEDYDDYISGNYMEPGNHRWNLESKFWLMLRSASRKNFSYFKSKEEISSLEHGVPSNVNIDRKTIFNIIMESFKNDDILNKIKFNEDKDSIIILDILIKKDSFYYTKDVTNNMIKREKSIIINNIEYDIFDLKLNKQV